jgi:hypothetical protein
MRQFGKVRQEKFKKKLLKLITAYGGYEGGFYSHIIPTKAGDLYVQVEREQSYTWFVPMRFEHPEKAVAVLTEIGKGKGNLNEYSGKYNVMFSKEKDLFEMFEYYVGLVAEKKSTKFERVNSLSDIAVGEVVQMTSHDFGGVVNRIVKIADDYSGLGRDIAYFGFFDRMKDGVPTPEEYANALKSNKSVPHAFAVWGFSLEHGTQLDKYA